MTLEFTPDMGGFSYEFELKAYLGTEEVMQAIIKFNVQAAEPLLEQKDPSFTEELDMVVTSALFAFEWSLPEIDMGSSTSVDVSIKPAELIASFVYFDSKTQKVFFEGSSSSKHLAGQTSRIDITLTTDSGNQVELPQVIRFNELE